MSEISDEMIEGGDPDHSAYSGVTSAGMRHVGERSALSRGGVSLLQGRFTMGGIDL